MSKSRALHRKPRSNTFVTERLTIGNGTAQALDNVTMLILRRGNCGNATVENPHNRGEQPQTCDRCYILT